MNIAYFTAFLDRDSAEADRERFMSSFESRIKNGDLFVFDDEVKLINNHYCVRILLGPPQKELDFE